MRKVFEHFDLETTGKIFVISLKALFRTVGVGGATDTGAIPASVLETLRVRLSRPDYSGVTTLETTGDCKYAIANDVLTITLAKLPAGISRLTVETEYGTNTKSLYVADLKIEDNIFYLNVDGTYTPLTRYAAKDETSSGTAYKAFKYTYGAVLVWLESDELKDGEEVTAFVADSLTATLADADEEDGVIALNSNVIVYDAQKSLNLNVTDDMEKDADTTYTAGENIQISAQHVISATDTKYTAGENVGISDQNIISAQGYKHDAQLHNFIEGRLVEDVEELEPANVASGVYSHAEGSSNTASGVYSHAEGKYTIASGECSHAEGTSTTASGYFSHAEGAGTIAVGFAQHVEGRFNVEDSDGRYLHIVGNGTDIGDRHNAFAIRSTDDCEGILVLFKPNGTSVELSATQLEQLLGQ